MKSIQDTVGYIYSNSPEMYNQVIQQSDFYVINYWQMNSLSIDRIFRMRVMLKQNIEKDLTIL